MKLVRYGNPGTERPGALDDTGTLRDLSHIVPDIDPGALSRELLERLSAVDLSLLPKVAGQVRYGCPIAHVGKIVCVGLNYRDHAEEAGMPIPEEPVLFLKPTSAINGPCDPILIPRDSAKTDWEVELAVVIGTRASHVPESGAMQYVAGYSVAHDVSERSYQFERGGQWDKGKGCDTFAPIGPWLVTTEEVKDPQSLVLWLDVNGERLQDGNTNRMIFGVRELVSYVSRFMTLHPGDVIFTGTPAGVGMGQKPPRFLKPGDTVALGIEGLGTQVQTCAAWTEASTPE